jgi:AcrR family transcriptional regulator
MAFEDRRRRDRDAQRRLITNAARAIAEREGWDAVTTRRLSSEVEYSQPVLYKHFASMEDLAEAVALEGFEELAEALRAARLGADAPDEALGAVARAFRRFAADSPGVYDAMFTRTTRLRFATDNAPSALSAAFSELHQAVIAVAHERDPDTLTEVFWSALHGLTTFDRAGRLRPGLEAERIDLLIAHLRTPPV